MISDYVQIVKNIARLIKIKIMKIHKELKQRSEAWLKLRASKIS